MSRGLGRLVTNAWVAVWMKMAWISLIGPVARRLAAWPLPGYKGRKVLARRHRRGYVSPIAVIGCGDLVLGRHVFVGDRVTIYGPEGEGRVQLGDGVHLHQDSIIEVGAGGEVVIGDDTHIQPRVQISAYKGRVVIGNGVQIAPNCAFYPYNHGVESGLTIKEQPLQTKGGIVLEDDVWLGFGVTVLDGSRVGSGAVIGAGSVVKGDIPPGAVAVGVPARVVANRDGESS